MTVRSVDFENRDCVVTRTRTGPAASARWSASRASYESRMPHAFAVVSAWMDENWMDVRCTSGLRYAGNAYASTPIAPRFRASLDNRPMPISPNTIFPASGTRSNAPPSPFPTDTTSASTPPAGVDDEFTASMLRFVAKRISGVADPTTVSDASSGSHAAFVIGRCSMRNVSRSVGFAAFSST